MLVLKVNARHNINKNKYIIIKKVHYINNCRNKFPFPF